MSEHEHDLSRHDRKGAESARAPENGGGRAGRIPGITRNGGEWQRGREGDGIEGRDAILVDEDTVAVLSGILRRRG